MIPIKRLKQNNELFFPQTAAEAVLVKHNGKETYLNEALEDKAYFHTYDLTIPNGVEGISFESYIFENNAAKVKGLVVIPVPAKCSYRLHIISSAISAGTILETDLLRYNVSNNLFIQVLEVDRIVLNFTDNVWINKIHINSTIPIPTKVSQLENDMRYLTGNIENEILVLR